MEKEDYGIVVDSFDKNVREQIRVSINEFKGNRYIDIRVFFKDANGREYLPSKKGVTLSDRKYPELLEAIVQLGEALGFSVADQQGGPSVQEE
jgi:hypothetical protein